MKFLAGSRLSPVHPRLRGELTSAGRQVSDIDGSSPLTRGTQLGEPLQSEKYRFIPAYAGNSLKIRPFAFVSKVHPRLRGELIRAAVLKSALERFIPAYAGNSSQENLVRVTSNGSSPLTRGTRAHSSQIVTPLSVHPRLRGELPISFTSRIVDTGSSPLTRGTLLRTNCNVIECRFIPAYAGNSIAQVRTTVKYSVHPRLRGELGMV